MYLPLGVFSPDLTLGFVAASRPCFPRQISERRAGDILKRCHAQGLAPFVPQGRCAVIETKEDACDASRQMREAGCDVAILYLGNFSPEIEDAVFVRQFDGPVMVLAGAEESADVLPADRGDALCGLLSACMALANRGLFPRVFLPDSPIVTPDQAVAAIVRFRRIGQVLKGVRNATIALFGPRPRDFETCAYSLSTLAALGVEVEELGFHDLANEVRKVQEKEDYTDIVRDMGHEICNVPGGEFANRLGAYEKALLNFRERLRLSGAATQCWAEQELCLRHAPCAINAHLAAQGFPVACENDAYSLVSELMGQYASDASVTVLDLNHSIPADLHPSLADYDMGDIVGLFHCGNTTPRRMKHSEMKHQITMKRNMEPDGAPDISRGTIEGQIAASPITVLQIQGEGPRVRAFIMEGDFLDIDPNTYGAVGTAHIPGFMRFYRHVLLGRFHHHAAVAFCRCGDVLYDALRLMGVEDIYTPLPTGTLYPGENPFGRRT